MTLGGGIRVSYSIAIDGPAGAGKSTIAKDIAKKLSFIYVDTGAMYRAMALYLINENIPIEQEAISENCGKADIIIEYMNQEQQVILNGTNVNSYIRTEEVGKMTSIISVNKHVREKLVDLQRELAQSSDVVMDGRDIGTAVLPNANLKIYLTASVETRANRRYLELQKKGESADLDQIEKDITTRDARDMTREISPLMQAKDAILVDSSNMSIDEVVAYIIELYFEDVSKKCDKV